MNYFLHLLIYLAIYSIVALSLNIVVGYCGLITLSHAGYFAIGAYTCTLAVLKLHWNFFPAVLLGVAVSMVLSLAVSLPALRFKGDFFVLISLAVQTMLFSALNNWAKPGAEVGTWKNLTNGSFGIASIPRPVFFGVSLDSMSGMATLACVFAGVCALIAYLLSVSPWGLTKMLTGRRAGSAWTGEKRASGQSSSFCGFLRYGCYCWGNLCGLRRLP